MILHKNSLSKEAKTMTEYTPRKLYHRFTTYRKLMLKIGMEIILKSDGLTNRLLANFFFSKIFFFFEI